MARRDSARHLLLHPHLERSARLHLKSIQMMALILEVADRRRSGELLQGTIGRKNLEKRGREQGKMLR